MGEQGDTSFAYLSMKLQLEKANKKNLLTYASLLQARLEGEQLNFDAVTEETFRTLYLEEGLLSKQIAMLFDVENITVFEKIKDYHLTHSLSAPLYSLPI